MLVVVPKGHDALLSKENEEILYLKVKGEALWRRL